MLLCNFFRISFARRLEILNSKSDYSLFIDRVNRMINILTVISPTEQIMTKCFMCAGPFSLLTANRMGNSRFWATSCTMDIADLIRSASSLFSVESLTRECSEPSDDMLFKDSAFKWAMALSNNEIGFEQFEYIEFHKITYFAAASCLAACKVRPMPTNSISFPSCTVTRYGSSSVVR